MDVAELQQVVNKASNLVSDTQAFPGTNKRRSFAIDEWTIYDKVCVCVLLLCIYILCSIVNHAEL